MNRIHLLEHQAKTTRQANLSPRRPKSLSPASRRTENCFFVPVHYEPNYAYPLVVWLHGGTDCHRQLKEVMRHLSVRNYVGVAPASPTGAPVSERLTMDWHSSEPQLEYDPVWDQSEEGIVLAYQQVELAIEQAEARFHIAPQRIFLVGIDEGGTMALRLGLAAPGRFAGVASIGGPLPAGNQPMSNLLQARGLPMLIAHGRDSESYTIDEVCAELKLCHAAGMCLNLRQYPCGQELTTQMLTDINAWIMEIVTGTAAGERRQQQGEVSLDERN